MSAIPITVSGMRSLLCGPGWSAKPPCADFNYESYWVSLEFGQQQASVTLACGQTMYFNTKCRYELLTPTTLQLACDFPPACLHHSATFVLGCKLVLPFTVDSGDFTVNENPLSSDFLDRWRWRIRFERHPFPDGVFFRLPIPTDYYGHIQHHQKEAPTM